MRRLSVVVAISLTSGVAGAAADPVCQAVDFSAPGNVCYRPQRNEDGSADLAPYKRKGPPSRADREEAQRWLGFYPLCETYLNAKMSQLDDEIHAQAAQPTPAAPGAPTQSATASAKLCGYRKALDEAQIDRHVAYDIIHDELHEELDYATWRDQVILGATFLGGAGGARDLGLDLHWDSRTANPAGFRYSVSLGAHGVRNVYLSPSPAQPAFNDLPLPRDPTLRLSVPLMGTLSWSWIQSSIFVSGGASWTPSANAWAIVGQVGIGFLESWLRNRPGNGAGAVAEARFLAQTFIPIDHAGPTSVLFGIELGLGVGAGHSWCNPDSPRAEDCHRLNER